MSLFIANLNRVTQDQDSDWMARWLQDGAGNNTSSGNGASSSSGGNNKAGISSPGENDSQVLRNTFAVYGTVWLLLIMTFCVVRLKWKKPYTIRQWVDEYKTNLAKSIPGLFSWIRYVRSIDDDQLMHECGMDATCLVRIMRMGFKIACVGCMNAVWLIPLYKLAPEMKNDPINDRIAQLTVANVPEQSNLLLFTVLACYILFGAVMYIIYQEFEWFIALRHKFLVLPTVTNYSIFVRNIPEEYRDNTGVEMFFRECFTPKKVVHEAQVAIKAPELVKWVKEREQVQQKLEHAIAYKEIKGQALQHKTSKCGGHKVDSISTFTNELRVLNDKISRRIDEMEQEREVRHHRREQQQNILSTDTSNDSDDAGDDQPQQRRNKNILHKASSGLVNTTAGVASTAAKIVTGGKDGEVLPAGFLTFSTLRARHAALQAVHHAEPYIMEVHEAPQPDDGE
jgi:preprotein translocase subunit SecG